MDAAGNGGDLGDRSDPTQLDALLEGASRTFALNIPHLPEPTRREVTVAYLLFRVADTFEDSDRWGPERRIAALEDFIQLLAEPDREQAVRLARNWSADPPLEHAGYLELLERSKEVLDVLGDLDAEPRNIVIGHVTRTAREMQSWVARTDPVVGLRLETLDELRAYCYAVAGIVGEMLTDLFLLRRPGLQAVAPRLREWAPSFGEGLQLTNILKDVSSDQREARRYLPDNVERTAVFELARRDLAHARAYTRALQAAGAEPGIVIFNALPVAMALATLDRVEQQGPGSKISRAEVSDIVRSVTRAVEVGEPVLSGP